MSCPSENKADFTRIVTKSDFGLKRHVNSCWKIIERNYVLSRICENLKNGLSQKKKKSMLTYMGNQICLILN